MEPGPNSTGVPHLVSPGISVVNFATMLSTPGTVRNFMNGISRTKSASARPSTVFVICCRRASDGPTNRYSNCARAKSGITLGARPPSINNVHRTWTNFRVDVQFHFPQKIQGFYQLLDGRFSQLWIRRVRHPALRCQLKSKGSLGSDGNLVLRGLAINKEAAAHWAFIGDLGPQTIALFTHQKQHAHRHAFFTQALASGDLCRNDAFGIARTSPVNIVMIFRR